MEGDVRTFYGTWNLILYSQEAATCPSPELKLKQSTFLNPVYFLFILILPSIYAQVFYVALSYEFFSTKPI
jgi:hypothetical protein